jgi:hypothetical protein
MTRCAVAATIALVCYLFPSVEMQAAYLFSPSAAEAESNIVTDLQTARLDQSNLAAGVAERTITFLQHEAPPLTKLILQSRLQQICPVLSVSDGNKAQYAFRSIHLAGKLDWIVATTGSPEIVNAITLLPPGGKAPAILPLVPSLNEHTITPSVEMGCSSEEQRKAAEEEMRKADSQFGRMSNGGR